MRSGFDDVVVGANYAKQAIVTLATFTKMIDPEEVSTIGGMVTVSFLHSLLPTHWLPFSLVGKAQSWTLTKTLLITTLGALGHVVSTSLMGLAAVAMAHTVLPEEYVHAAASGLLIIMGIVYIFQNITGKGHCSHAHHGGGHRMDRMATVGLVLVPTLTPCASTLPMFLAVAESGFSGIIKATTVLLVTTLTVMLTLVTLSYLGASRFKFDSLKRYDRFLVGIVLILVGFLTIVLHHDHDHDHDHDHGQGGHGAGHDDASTGAIYGDSGDLLGGMEDMVRLETGHAPGSVIGLAEQ
eukprot:jgi/Mesvir1/21254/Mv21658-RA.1